jgi:vacuole membrane protein 1
MASAPGPSPGQPFDHLLHSNDQVTPQQISDFDHYRREAREQLTLYNHPWKTVQVAFQGLLALIYHSFRYILYHQVFIYVLLPTSTVVFILHHFPGAHTPYLDNLKFGIEYVVWWVGLGILSSIGLGSGLQSGVLFLFPHIFKTCLAAQTCGTMDFDSAEDMWFRSHSNLFKCPDVITPENTPVSFGGMWRKIILVCFLQSAGTAIGEIPPYWMTRAARLAALEAGGSQASEIPEELEANSKYSLINKAKEGMVWFLQSYGFLGVLIMASYPNIAFDLCGICCGHFLMPFWTFFLATFIGKAIIRNSYQSVAYVMLCRLVQTLCFLLYYIVLYYLMCYFLNIS